MKAQLHTPGTHNFLCSKALTLDSAIHSIHCLLGSGLLHITTTAVLGSCPLCWHLRNATASCCNWAVPSPTASSGFSSWALSDLSHGASLYELFNPEASAATEPVPSPMASHGTKPRLLSMTLSGLKKINAT